MGWVHRYNQQGPSNHPLADGLFHCEYCGQSITGERIRCKLKGGGVREHLYILPMLQQPPQSRSPDGSLDKLGDMDPARGELAVSLFDWTQQAADIWRGSNNSIRREILDAVCLNRCLNDEYLVLTKRKPFGAFAERLLLKNSRGDRIRTCDPRVPNAVL